MITYVYVCNSCSSPDESRSFEVGYPDMETARSAPVPLCPWCGSSEGVARSFRYNIYGPGKTAQSDHLAGTRRFVDIKSGHRQGIVSIGIRAETEEVQEIERHIVESVEESGLQVVDVGEKMAENPDYDPTEAVLGLKRGSVERALFDVRQRNMLDELRNGAPISGFFMPISGEYGN